MARQADDPIERLFAVLHADYAGRMEPEKLAEVLRSAYQHAEHLDLLGRPWLVDRAVRDLLEEHAHAPAPPARPALSPPVPSPVSPPVSPPAR